MRCAILNDYQQAALSLAPWNTLPPTLEVTVFDRHISHDLDELAATLEPFEIVVAMRERTPFPAELFARLPRLKLLCSTAKRNPSIDLAGAARHGVVVCGTASLIQPTAELTWGLILALLRHIPAEDRNVREGGRWQTTIGVDLFGKTLGLLGLGTLGQQVARVGQAFGMKVIAWSNNLTEAACAEHGCEHVGKDDLVRRSDVLSIHTQLSRRTTGLIGRREFGMMKRTVVLINTSRGFIVDEGALLDALTTGQIAGAGLDVFEVEPLPSDHPLRRLRNTVVTPHLGYVTEDNYRLFYGTIVENIAAFLAGQPIRVMDPAINVDRSL